MKNKYNSVNRYGVDMGYVSSKLRLLLGDLSDYTPEELARVLVRLSMAVDTEETKQEVDRMYERVGRGL